MSKNHGIQILLRFSVSKNDHLQNGMTVLLPILPEFFPMDKNCTAKRKVSFSLKFIFA
jgi:hypothetical protein